MKSIFIFFGLCILSISCKDKTSGSTGTDPASNPYLEVIRIPATADNPVDTVNVAKINFEESSFDFGTITDQTKVSHKFRFTNTGKVRLLITDVSTTCGCTVAGYPKGFILPSQEGEITVDFDPKGKEGEQNKTVIVTANTEPLQTKILIKAIVNKTTK